MLTDQSMVGLFAVYASADILLFPSDVETFGNVTLEALSSGCPAVVEKKCGDHLVQDGINGYTCPCGDSEAFYQATKKIVLDTILRKQMSIAAREEAKKFDRKIILQQMLENYKDSIEKHRDPSFLKQHLTRPKAKGWNFLSVMCCNYFLVKKLAEPFLLTSRGVQDMVEGGVECISLSRSRLSCSEYMNTATDIEEGDNQRSVLYDDAVDRNQKRKTRRFFPAFAMPKLAGPVMLRLLKYFTTLCAIMLILLFVYATFTV